MDRLKAILIKEFIQMKRDSVTMGIMIILPIVQLLLFGFAIHTDIKNQATVVFDQSLTQESRELLTSFSASEYFALKYYVHSFQEVNNSIDHGKAKVGIIIPPDLAANIKHGNITPIQVIVDASDSNAAASAIAAAETIGQLKSREVIIQKQKLSEEKMKIYDIRIRAWYNPDFITAWYMIPGIMGIILTMTMVMITSMAIVRERERGTLEQLLVTPLKPWELLIGKVIPYIAVGYIQTTVALLVGIGIFSLPLRGSILSLYILTTLFIIASLTLGLVISNISRTQMQAMQTSFFIFMPSVLLSGFIFPREAMPKIFYYLSAVLPMTYYVEILRGIILRGNSIDDLWGQAITLIIIIIITFGIAIKKFSRTIN